MELAQSDDPKRMVILAQYDPGKGLPAHVRIHLQRLRPHADRLILVSNSDMDSASQDVADSLCDRVLIRENRGWDFAAWRDVLAWETAADWDSIILTNSSIVGPFYPIGPVITEMEARGADFWGLVHSKQLGSHLQSFFLGFGPRVLKSAAWADFWARVLDLNDKWDVIKTYELGLTKHFTRAGFSFDAFMKNPAFPASIRIVDVERLGGVLRLPWDINRVGRTIRDHEAMLREGFPYLKASLLWGQDRHRVHSIAKLTKISGVNYPWDEIGFANKQEIRAGAASD